MKLQQLRYALEIYRQRLNVSAAADRLFTSQPGVSKQIRLLEDELGIQIFIRQGKRIVSVTEPGLAILEIADKILSDTKNIKKIGQEFSSQKKGKFILATPSSLAKYVLPNIIGTFLKKYPDVECIIKQGSPLEVCKLVEEGNADLGMIMELEEPLGLCLLPSYLWERTIVVPKEHKLAQINRLLTLEDIIKYPVVTYEYAFSEKYNIYRAFADANLDLPKIALLSSDPEVIKSYVRLGLGIGIMSSIAYNKDLDIDLVMIPCNHLFKESKVNIVLNYDRYLRGFMYEFIEAYDPNLTQEKVNQIMYTHLQEDYSI